MNEEQIQDSNSPSGRATAVSVFEQSNGMNDFPVLKAFQEYIEAEQARARKRMLGLSIFFVVLLVVVVVTFAVIMAAVINRDQQSLSAIATRNQELSDKLLDIALRERGQQPVINVGQPTPVAVSAAPGAPASPTDNAAALQPVLERLEKLATSLNKPQPQVPAPPVVPVAAPAPQLAPVDPGLVAEQRRQAEIHRQREAIAAERAKIKAAQEQLRLEQVEQHRRRLYPEYYAQADAHKKAEDEAKRAPAPLPPQSVPPVPSVTQVPVKKESAAVPVVVPARKEITPAIDRKAIDEAQPVDLKSVKPISYFDQEDEAPSAALPAKKAVTVPSKAPVESVASSNSPSPVPVSKPVKEKEASKTAVQKTETLTVGAQGQEQIPWLIELPEKK